MRGEASLVRFSSGHASCRALRKVRAEGPPLPTGMGAPEAQPWTVKLVETTSEAKAFEEFERLRAAYANVSKAEQNLEITRRPFPRPERLPGASDAVLWRLSLGLSGGARTEGVDPLDLDDVAGYAGVPVHDVERYLAATRSERTAGRQRLTQ